MKPLQPFKANDFTSLFTPIIPPPIIPPLPPVMNSSPNPPKSDSDGSSNILMYVGISILAIGVIAIGVHMVLEKNEITRQVSQARVEIKALSQELKAQQSSQNVLPTSKTTNHGTTEKSTADTEPEQSAT